MMRSLLICLICCAPVVASAQYVSQQPAPAPNIEQRIGAQIGALAIQNAQLSLQVEMLQQQLSEARERIKKLETPPAPPAAPEKN